ncbi:hypothetical protein NP233_g6890 [Leucocoprinus birnbaumii]|uniref:FAD-binding PCMH-type domain-containing protein n=1 Tax=Leucocoprinus birnbaumii TaxID=56174 RepID=A0AAD5VSM3_9AGAR|nr:hypothetical protein NP233_g6890 [Leucocoprinus birnbaumii]
MSMSFEELKQRIQGDVVTQDHPEYPKSIYRWAINAEKRAAIVVFVKDEGDIATVLSYVRDHKIPLAICGGGHSASGASSVTGGLVIDLSRYLDGVRVDPEERLAYVGGGALWGTVDRTAIQYGLATVCGTVEHTGVGGLALGGGYGWLCPEHGLVIDNMVQVTVVSADGVARKASETENSDLFFGVRGGGCNFGVVTEFVLRLHPQRRTVYAGAYSFSADKLKAVVEAIQTWLPSASPKEGMIMMTTCQPDGTPVIVCYLFFNGSEDEGRARFRWLFDIGPFQDTTEEMPFEKLNGMQDSSLTDHGHGIYWKGLTVKCPDYEAIARAHKRIAEICEDGRFGAVVIYEWWSLDKVMSVPPEKTVFHRSRNPLCLALVAWNGETNSEEKVNEARKYAYEIAELAVAGLTDMSDPENRGYNNYDNEGVKDAKDEIQDKAKVNFGVHYPALQKIKKKYDPENIFNRWQAITPAD